MPNLSNTLWLKWKKAIKW